VASEEFVMSSLFDKHDTDAFRINMGPDGWMLCIQDLDMMEDVSTIRAKEVYPKWPGEQSAITVNIQSIFLAH
jgi:hypothetical protein